ncbi:hypothetical protein [uncultured Gemmiger sp.]|uniref:hypothetical protein n=1 Tax=uncultured Gemmiger sp. TaxID=1623490 RepID=UPI002804708D|nr:hypothetical protein [uncultured Gemmiger sp.]
MLSEIKLSLPSTDNFTMRQMIYNYLYMYSYIDNVQKRLYNEDRFYAEIQKESEVFVMDSPSRKSQNKVLVLIVGLLIVAVIAAYGVISSGVLEEKIDAEMEITAQIESDNLAYVTVETNLPDETNIIISLVGAGNSNDTGYNTNYKADDSLQIVDGRAVAGPFSNNGVALPFGNYKVEVTVPLAETQPQDVQKVFGKNMRNVRGDLVVEDESGNYLYKETALTMPDLANGLTTQEKKLYDGALSWIVMQRLASIKGGQDIIVSNMSFNDAVRDDTRGMVWIDYKTTTYNFDADKSLDSENHEALMLLDYIGVTKRFTNIPIGYIFDDAADDFGLTYYAVKYSTDHTYTSDELEHINKALEQLTSWVKIERDGFDEVISTS